MNIDPLKRQTQVSSLQQVVSKREDQNPSGDEEGMRLDVKTHENLMGQLNEMPESRPDVVALGRKLAEDPNYPSDDVLEKLSEVLIDVGDGSFTSM